MTARAWAEAVELHLNREAQRLHNLRRLRAHALETAPRRQPIRPMARPGILARLRAWWRESRKASRPHLW